MNILCKNLKELRQAAAKAGIKGRSKMNQKQLQAALWQHFYQSNLPKGMDEATEFLLLHPDREVRELFRMWCVVGPAKLARSLEIIASAIDTDCDNKAGAEFFGKSFGQYANQNVKTAGAYFGMTADALDMVYANYRSSDG